MYRGTARVTQEQVCFLGGEELPTDLTPEKEHSYVMISEQEEEEADLNKVAAVFQISFSGVGSSSVKKFTI